MDLEDLHIKNIANSIYTGFRILEAHKTELYNHLGDVNRSFVSVWKEPWKFNYPEHVDEFKKLRIFINKGIN